MSLQSMRTRCMTAAAGAALWVWIGAGCATRGNVDALEAHLRQTQDQLRRSEKELARTRSERDTARHETELVRQQAASAGNVAEAILPEHTQSLSRIANLSINRMMSGGKDNDGDKRDEALQVIVAPLDGDGDLVKIAGTVEIEAYDLSRSGEDKRIGRWQFDAAEARKHWHSGFLSSGFQFHLPWQEAPGGKDILVHARLTTSDGRQFDTNQTLLVNAHGAGSAPIRAIPPAEPGRLAPPVQLQPALEQASVKSGRSIDSAGPDEFQPLPQMSRPLKKTAEVDAAPFVMRGETQADTTVSVGKAGLDSGFDDAGFEDTAETILTEAVSTESTSPWPIRPASNETPLGASGKFEKYRPEAPFSESRPAVVPPPRDVDGAPASRSRGDDAPRPVPPSVKRSPAPATPAAKPGSEATTAPPFPRGLSTTSDAWTDETIPRLR